MTNGALDPRIVRVALTLALVTLPLKIVAIWRAVRADQKGWLVAMLLLNTLGILELTYLFYFHKPTSREPN